MSTKKDRYIFLEFFCRERKSVETERVYKVTRKHVSIIIRDDLIEFDWYHINLCFWYIF